MDNWLEMIQKVVRWLKGRKSYVLIIAFTALLLGSIGGWAIPAWLLVLVGAAGLITLKAGQNRIEQNKEQK